MQRKKGLLRGILILSFFSILILKIKEYNSASKWAIREGDFSNYPNCIIIKESFHTGTGWEIIGDSNGFYTHEGEDGIRGIIVLTKMPVGVVGHPLNSFLCIVEYKGETFIDNPGSNYDTYEIKDWYPVYPVRRTNVWVSDFFYSKHFLRVDEVESLLY